MRRLLLLLSTAPSAVLTMAACMGDDPLPVTGDSDAGPSNDASMTADARGGESDAALEDGTTTPVGPCDLSKPFGKPTKLADFNTNGMDDYPRFASNGEELFLSRTVTTAGGQAAGIVQYVKGDGGMWGSPTTLAVNDIGDGGLMHSYALTLTADGKNGFFSRTDKFSFNRGISKITRSGPKEAWSRPIVVSVTDPAGQPAAPISPWINEDATRLYFEGNSGTPKLYQAPFNGVGYGPAKAIGFDADDRGPVLSRDEKRIYFGSVRPHPGGASGATFLVYTSTRASIDAPFGPPQFVTELNEGAAEMRPSWLSADACTILLFGRLEGGTNDTDVFVAKKPAF